MNFCERLEYQEEQAQSKWLMLKAEHSVLRAFIFKQFWCRPLPFFICNYFLIVFFFLLFYPGTWASILPSRTDLALKAYAVIFCIEHPLLVFFSENADFDTFYSNNDETKRYSRLLSDTSSIYRRQFISIVLFEPMKLT